MNHIAHLLALIAAGTLAYLYIGYPMLLWCLSAAFGRDRHGTADGRSDDDLPGVTIFIPAYNEEAVIEAKIANCRQLEYPAEKLQIAVASDGSTDRTNTLLAACDDSRVVTFISPENRGKNALINSYVPETSGDILVFTDANAHFAADALRHLVAPFADPRVACVGGRLRYLEGGSGVARGEGIYFRYENRLRAMEGRLGCLIGANGAIYAIRRAAFLPVPGHTPNDMFHPLASLCRGQRAVFAPAAVASEPPSETAGDEFRRRRRIVTRSVGAFVEAFRGFGPPRPLALFCFVSHKLVRWFGLPLFALALLGGLLSPAHPLSRLIVAGCLLVLVSAGLGAMAQRAGRRVKLLYVPYYFMLINLAGMLGVWEYVSGRRVTTWQPAASTR